MILLAFALLSGIQSAPAAPVVAKPVVVNGKKAVDPNKLICKQQEMMGSRLGGKRICRTSADWNADQIDSRIATEQAQRVGRMPGD